jgi:peptidoglycan/LPS O-acetylase OafA/YrhL
MVAIREQILSVPFPHPMALIDRLARRTTSGRYIPEIDGLRFIAIAAVVVFHVASVAIAETGYDGWAFRIARGGRYGVQLFFMISGFVLALPFAQRQHGDGPPVSLRAYFTRRLTRIEPPYLVAMLGCAALLFVAHSLRGTTTSEIWPHLAASLLYQHNLVYGSLSTINIVAWSLEIEVQFYCLAPLLARLFAIPKTAVRRLAISGLAVALFGISPRWGEGALGLSLLAYLHYFLVGWLLADVYVAGWPRALRSDVVRRVLGNRWIATVGGMCYSIYLLHYPVLLFIGHRTAGLTRTVGIVPYLAFQFLVTVPIVLVVSTGFFMLIERPCMDPRWPRHLVARLRECPVVFAMLADLDRPAVGHLCRHCREPIVYPTATCDHCDAPLAGLLWRPLATRLVVWLAVLALPLTIAVEVARYDW